MDSEILRIANDLIDNCETAIIWSVDSLWFPNIKAMLKPRERDWLKIYYFTTNTSSIRVKQFLKNPKSSIYFFDSMKFQWIMLKWLMEVVQDQKTKDRIWRDWDTMYYPWWIMDPDYSVLKFTADSARLYSHFRSYDFEI